MTSKSLTPDDLGTPAQLERRTRILRAAMTLASEGGFEQVQMRAVAEDAGVALGTLYRYFPSKLHLLVSLLAQQLGLARENFARVPVPGTTPTERVIHVLGRVTGSLHRDPHLTEALVRAYMFADASVAHELHDVVGHVAAMLTGAMRDPGSPDGAAAPPTADEIGICKVVGDVWFASLVRGVTGRATTAEVVGSTELAVRLLLG